MVVGGGIWYEAARDFSKTTSTQSSEIQAAKVIGGISRVAKYTGWVGNTLSVGVDGYNAVAHWNSTDAGYYKAKAVASTIIVGLNAINFIAPGLGTGLSIVAGIIDTAGGFDWIYDSFREGP